MTEFRWRRYKEIGSCMTVPVSEDMFWAVKIGCCGLVMTKNNCTPEKLRELATALMEEATLLENCKGQLYMMANELPGDYDYSSRFTMPGPLVSVGPVNCKKCNFRNDYGSPNQQDGSYLCYQCRP